MDEELGMDYLLPRYEPICPNCEKYVMSGDGNGGEECHLCGYVRSREDARLAQETWLEGA